MSDLDKFRKDFALVWKWWISQRHETQEAYEYAGRVVKQNLKDAAFMRGAMNHFAFMADAIRRDLERSARIRAEVRAEKEAAK